MSAAADVDGGPVRTGDGPGGGPWLDAHEQRVWRSYLEGTQRLWEHLGAVLDADGDVPLQEYEVLVRLSETPGGSLRMSELAHALVHSRSRLTHTVGRMEARGLVERRACPDDGRGVLCVVTDEGRAALERHAPAHVASVRAALFDLLEPAEVDALGSALEKVAANLRG
ncbi:MarR family transcriptional regulator [Pseudokineococcus marinus]|uniref:MarR family transcriptional regulator n=1 Tax=Pseudokineococcus marinus TaxID=351215 RepID=A0A849BP06_9ACTN|nr:MarR family transcriptional regulator [Pseudokineococcus marinus]NNH23165.1 MarR family transcriptional regulator [Pseudokineococcus marinus]